MSRNSLWKEPGPDYTEIGIGVLVPVALAKDLLTIGQGLLSDSIVQPISDTVIRVYGPRPLADDIGLLWERWYNHKTNNPADILITAMGLSGKLILVVSDGAGLKPIY